MKTFAALSAIGKDQPGIVAALSKILFESGCNLEDSSMTRLKGDFAVLLLISLPTDSSLEKLKSKLQSAAKKWGLTFSIRDLSPEEATAEKPVAIPYTLIVYGVDHPGIVYRITQAASDLFINITDLRTLVTQGNQTPLYSLIVELEIPSTLNVDLFQKQLDLLKKELKVEITLNPVEANDL